MCILLAWLTNKIAELIREAVLDETPEELAERLEKIVQAYDSIGREYGFTTY